MANEMALLHKASLESLKNIFGPGQTVHVSDLCDMALLLNPIRSGGERATVLSSFGDDYCVVRINRTLSAYGSTARGMGWQSVPAHTAYSLDMRVHRSFLVALRDRGKIIDA